MTAHNAESWGTLKRIVADALERPADQRHAFLRESCADDPALLAEALALVDAAADEAGTGVLHPRTDAFLGLRGPDPAGLAGRTFGHYELIRLLGEGAMAAVYLARQQGVERPAAVKVLRAGAVGYDAPGRFAREVKALGRIEHDGVARIYDAGTTRLDGGRPTPWIAMEHVDGLPLTRHADVHAVDLPGRLRLAIDVADAVHAAHQKAVVHRDLKPGNVLVTGDGRVKVLDFGIARVVRDDDRAATMQTTAGVLLGTLGYMAPEQARGDGDAVDVRSDVYALGVLLHELVTGRLPTPTQGVPLTEALRRLAEPDVTPATVGPIDGDDTGGDLHTVLVTALAAEPSRRYASAEAFADDLRRLLRHEPIDARPPTRAYLARKFVRRHRGGVVAGAAVALALVAGTVVSAVGFAREATARREAEAALAQSEVERSRAAAARGFFNRVLEAPDFAGDADLTLLEAVNFAEPALLEYADGDDLVARDLRITLARVYRGLGEIDAADAEYRLAEGHAARAPTGDRLTPVEVAVERADTLATHFRPIEARGAHDAARAAFDAVAAGPNEVESRGLGRVRALLAATEAAVLDAEGDYATAAEKWLAAIALAEARVDPDDPEGRRSADALPMGELMSYRSNASSALLSAGRVEEGLALMRIVVPWKAQTYGPDHPTALTARHNLAYALNEAGDFEAAEAESRRVMADAAAALGEGHPLVAGSRRLVVSIALNRGGGAVSDEIAEFAARGVAEARADDDGAADLPMSLTVQAHVLMKADRPAEAAAAFAETLELVRERFGVDHPFVLVTRSNLGGARVEAGEFAAGLADLRAVLDEQRAASGPDSVAYTLNTIGFHEFEHGDAAAAVAALREAVELCEEHGYPALHPVALRNLGRALARAGDLDAAEAALLASREAGTAENAVEADKYLAEVRAAR